MTLIKELADRHRGIYGTVEELYQILEQPHDPEQFAAVLLELHEAIGRLQRAIQLIAPCE